jgi:hypothetical protein
MMVVMVIQFDLIVPSTYQNHMTWGHSNNDGEPSPLWTTESCSKSWGHKYNASICYTIHKIIVG